MLADVMAAVKLGGVEHGPLDQLPAGTGTGSPGEGG